MTNTTAGFEPDTKENLKILVVDDEPDVQPMVQQAMRPEIRSGKYSFLFAGNGDEALEQLDQNQDIQILISDINMPRMDGLTLLDHLSERNADLRSIIVSAYGDMKNIRQAMNRGAFDFITKPLDFEDLKVTIERSRNNLLKWRRAMEARDRLLELEYELNMASRMQKAILPTIFPSGPDYEMHGYMHPAHEVSGDFFDVINLDQGRIGLAIADVSGKGVPAALFMMSSRTILKAAAIGLQEPASVLEEVNNLIHKDNENTMFITLLYAVYDPRTGLLTYANGGHCNPLLLHPQQGCTELPTTPGGRPGTLPRPRLPGDHRHRPTGRNGRHVHRRSIGSHEPGRAGVRRRTAENPAPGHPASRSTAGQHRDPGGRARTHRGHPAIRRHHLSHPAPERENALNRTMQLDFEPGGSTEEDQDLVLHRITNAVDQLVEREGWEAETAFQVNLVLEEVSLNVMVHGGTTPGRSPSMRITIHPQDEELNIEVSDTGRPFNPLEDAPIPAPFPDTGPIDTGGLGVHLIRNLVSSISYRNDQGMNRLTMTLNCARTAGSPNK